MIQVNILSPTLFSLHNEGKGMEAKTSLPRLLKTAGDQDYKHWLDFIVEASGTTDAIRKLQEHVELPPRIASMPRGVDGQPLYFTRDNLSEIAPEQTKNFDVLAQLSRTLSHKQVFEIFLPETQCRPSF
ncbi:unnamed protein product [Gongylonema pulchrum]|uniref:Peroxidase n=1 Tax=Gongylonema pulchrum TaxID=637853 RepID=A0A183EH87_9BILA|nr:unnamed protein product [Gongylonema pulchrum]